MIVLDFSVKKSKRPNEAWFSQVIDWVELSEMLMQGDVQFSVNGIDFGVKNNFIIAVADTLVIAADRVLFYEDKARISYPEYAENLLFERQGKTVKVASLRGRQVVQETYVDISFLCREIGAFSKRVIWHLFEEYPVLVNNMARYAGCPHQSLRFYYYQLAKNPSLSSSIYE